MINVMSPQDALLSVMILVSAADREMSEAEMKQIGMLIQVIPAFKNYDRDRIDVVSKSVAEMLQQDDGLDAVIGMAANALPDRLRETAYVLACDVAAADGEVKMEERQLLEMIRHGFSLGRLVSAAIERSARARHMPAPLESDG